MTNIIEFDQLTLIQRVILKQKCEKSFLNFVRIFFELLQGDRLLINWHHRWMAAEIDAVVRGAHSSQSLAVSLPPGGTKTEFWSIGLPAYEMMLVKIGELSRVRNLNVSFADTLVKRNSRRTRDIIKSVEFQEFWPLSFGVNQAEEWDVINESGKVVGQTVSRAMGGQITGGRAGYWGEKFSGAVVLDDPDKPQDMFSSTKRLSQQRKLTNTIRSRRGDKSKDHPTPFFVIQQRLHVEDTIGFCLNGGADGKGGMGIKFKQITIPALITEAYIETLPQWVQVECWKSIRGSESRIIGGVEHWSYWPQMEDIGQLIDLQERDPYTFASQYMQAPNKLSGGLVDCDWFGRYTTLPQLEYMAVYVDTNSGKVTDKNDFNVFTLVGKGVDGNLYLIDIARGKWTPTELLKLAGEKWNEWRSLSPANMRVVVRHMSIEDKQAGQGLIADLQKENAIPVKPVQRGTNQNKYVRHCNSQPKIKMGKVFIPLLHDPETGDRIGGTFWSDGSPCCSNEWVIAFMAECDALTVGVLMDQETGYDDQYDTLMDAIDEMLDATTIDYGKLL